MNRIAALPAFALFAALSASAFAQPSQPAPTAPAAQTAAVQVEPATLAAILTELRGIHNDVRLGQTTQILLTELEVQENAVNRATSRRDDARNKLSQLQANEQNITSQLTHMQNSANDTIDPNQVRQLKNIQDQLKNSLAGLVQQEKDRTNELADADNALRREQDTLEAIQDRLDSVVKRLQPAVPNP